MLKLGFKYIILMAMFFLVLLTSLWPNNIYLLVFFSLTTYIVLPFRKYWDGISLTLLLFSFYYSIVIVISNQYGSGSLLISYLIAPVAFYRFGRWIMSVFYDDKVRQRLLFCIVTCYLLSLFIMTFKDIALVGIVNVSRVLLGDLNDGEGLAATLYGLMASLGIGCIASLFTRGQNIWLRFCYILLSSLSILVVIHLVNRTGLVILFVCIIISFIISTKKSVGKFLATSIFITVLALVIVNTSVINEEIIDAYQQREIDSFYDATSLGGRSAIWSDALMKLVTHPLGWSRVHYAHNMWLDVARIGGWLALLFFLIPTISWCKNLLSLARKEITPFLLIVLSLNCAMLISSFVEPVIEGSMLFFSIFMMFWGLVASLAKE